MIPLDQVQVGVRQMNGTRLGIVSDLTRKYLEDNPHRTTVLMVEVGSYEGVSALHWSHTIGDAGRSGTVTCIDPRKPYLHDMGNEAAARMNHDLASGAVLHRFNENRKLEHPKVWLRTVEGGIESFLGLPGAFDIVFIDGCHLFDACLADIVAGAKLLREGGLLCGDDLEKEMTKDALPLYEDIVDECMGGYHPGVSLAVATYFGPPGSVWVNSGVWAVRKTKQGFTPEGVA